MRTSLPMQPSDGPMANSPTQAPRLSPSRLAALLGVSPATILRWCAAGRINARKSPGGRWWIDPQVIHVLLEHFSAPAVRS